MEVGDRVMVHMPGSVKGKVWKLARPFHGPYRVISVTPTNAEVWLVDQPGADAIFVSLSKVRPYRFSSDVVSNLSILAACSLRSSSSSADTAEFGSCSDYFC